MPSDPIVPGFAQLDQAERDRLTGLLQPLPWIEGLMTALAIAPGRKGATLGMVECIDLVWSVDDADKVDELTEKETGEIVDLMMGQYTHVLTDVTHSDGYCPYLAGYSDPLEVAGLWAAGFGGGFAFRTRSWARFLDDEYVQSRLEAIFSLVSDEDVPEDARAEPAFRAMTPAQREQMRRSALDRLPQLVRELHERVGKDGAFEPDDEDEYSADPQEPYVRATPKVGRNDPCPCGSGKKYKKCCLV
jgi:uncharacterized protein